MSVNDLLGEKGKESSLSPSKLSHIDEIKSEDEEDNAVDDTMNKMRKIKDLGESEDESKSPDQ